jgi:hypothetical protein
VLTIFNRRELLITFDIQRQAEVRSLLAQNKIAYSTKVISINGPSIFGGSRARTGNFGIRSDYQYEYKVFVNKSDFDLATAIINNQYKR